LSQDHDMDRRCYGSDLKPEELAEWWIELQETDPLFHPNTYPRP